MVNITIITIGESIVKQFIVVITIVILIVVGNSVMATGPQYTMHHGALCQPANLGQSINFQTSWGATGIRNPNALGSGRSFFVICPMVVPDDNAGIGDTSDIFLSLFYEDHDGATQANCFARRYRGGTLVKQVAVTQTLTAGTTGFRSINLESITDLADGSFNNTSTTLAERYVLICNLPPQAAVHGYTYDYD